MISWNRVRYFKREEFQDPSVGPESGDLIDATMLMVLDNLRHSTGWPIVIHWQTGGAVDVHGTHGHASNSYHLASQGCKAVDFHFVTNASIRRQFYEICKRGFPGIGFYPEWNTQGFHVDCRPPDRLQFWKLVKGKYVYWFDSNQGQADDELLSILKPFAKEAQYALIRPPGPGYIKDEDWEQLWRYYHGINIK